MRRMTASAPSPRLGGLFAILIAFGLPGAAFAQAGASTNALALATQASEAGDRADAQTEAGDTAASGAIDWTAVNLDDTTLLYSAKPWSPPAARDPLATQPEWERKQKSDGSTAVTVKRTLPTEWDTKVGVDLGLPPTAPSTFQPETTFTADPNRSTGAAWANISVPGASVEARLDPTQEQSKLGTVLSKSVPLGDTWSMTLQNGYSVTNNLAATSTTPSQVFSTDQTAKLNLVPTGTSFSLGNKLSSTDDRWLRSVGAQQKLFDSLSISGTISETATGALDKSITAGFRKTW
jgi:hypothetical protein